MKLKKLLALLLAVSMLFVFAACEKDDDDDDDDKDSKKEVTENVDEEDEEEEKSSKKDKEDEEEGEKEPSKKTVKPGVAVWSGYDSMPFADFLQEAMENMYDEQGVAADVEVTVSVGWDEEELDEDDVDTAYSYELVATDGTETAGFIFYMSLEDGELEVQGARIFIESGENSMDEFGDAEKAEGALNSLVSFM